MIDFSQTFICVVATMYTVTCVAPSQQEDGREATVVLAHAHVFDGLGDAVRSDMSIVITGERITAVIPAKDAIHPADATIIDLKGKWVIPGLIDSHVHILRSEEDERAASDRLRDVLIGGVTTVRDMAGHVEKLAALSRTGRAPEAASPRIYYVALFAGPSFFDDPRAKYAAGIHEAGAAPWMMAITEQTNLPEAVATAKALEVSAIKVYADLTADLVRAVTEEAHRQNLPVWCHATVFPTKPSEALAAGVDSLSHAALLVWEPAERTPERYHIREPRPDYEATPGDHPTLKTVFDAMVANGCFLDATVAVMQRIGQRNETGQTRVNPMFEWSCKVTKFAHECGVPIVAGTDNMGPPASGALPNLHHELQVLVSECGLSPAEALKSATSNAARLLRADSEIGSVSPGKIADLVILKGDPTQDISNTRNIEFVMKGGHIHRRP